MKYPIISTPVKIVSHNLDKEPEFSDTLTGIKGQYLIFQQRVINLRKYSGYNVEFSFSDWAMVFERLNQGRRSKEKRETRSRQSNFVFNQAAILTILALKNSPSVFRSGSGFWSSWAILTLLARPNALSKAIAIQVMSISKGRKPCRADLGKAWWLLCHPSPYAAKPTHQQLVERSFSNLKFL